MLVNVSLLNCVVTTMVFGTYTYVRTICVDTNLGIDYKLFPLLMTYEDD